MWDWRQNLCSPYDRVASVTPGTHNVRSNVEQDHTRGSIIQLYRPPRRARKSQEWQATQSCRQYYKSYLQSGLMQTIMFSLSIWEILNGYNVIIVGLIALVLVFTSVRAKTMFFILARSMSYTQHLTWFALVLEFNSSGAKINAIHIGCFYTQHFVDSTQCSILVKRRWCFSVWQKLIPR